jgi:hypothetical protein
MRRLWRDWLSRFGLAEAADTTVAVAVFGTAWQAWGSLPAASALAAVLAGIAFYSVVGIKTAVRALTATGHLRGWRRALAAGWHATHDQVVSCAAAEALYLVAGPALMSAVAWVMRSLPGGIWAGFLIGKFTADAMWYATEVHARAATAWLVGLGHHWRNPPPETAPAATPSAQQFIRTGRWGP